MAGTDRGAVRLTPRTDFLLPFRSAALEIVKVLNDPAVRDQLNKHGLTPHPTSRAELQDFMRKESAKWGQIVRDRNELFFRIFGRGIQRRNS